MCESVDIKPVCPVFFLTHGVKELYRKLSLPRQFTMVVPVHWYVARGCE